MLDPKLCYRALKARDVRFDGRLFVGVTSTGIYCRPVCPVTQPRFENCRFYPSAAAAQDAGFRPCLRCRPETVLDLGAWRGTSNTVSRGLALIAEGALDGDERGVEQLAERLGVGGRQLRRLFEQHLGASPVAVAQTRRVLFAKQLLHETELSMTEVALAAGFGSVRRFNELFRGMFRRPPSELRRSSRRSPRRAVADTGVTIRLRYRRPYDWPALLDFFRARTVPGVESVGDSTYARSILQDGAAGTLSVVDVARRDCLAVTVHIGNLKSLPAIAARVRRMFDMETDVSAIYEQLAEDSMLAPRIAARPGLRVPGGWDGFEIAVRAVLGQQISVAAARRLVLQLVTLCGRKLPRSGRSQLGLTHLFPSATQVASCDLAPLGMPQARKRTLHALARAASDDAELFQPQASIDDTVKRLLAIPGVGEWTAHYIALRAARDPDAFPAADAGLLRAASLASKRPSPAELSKRAERWRPWRAYAAQQLWSADGADRKGEAP